MTAAIAANERKTQMHTIAEETVTAQAPLAGDTSKPTKAAKPAEKPKQAKAKSKASKPTKKASVAQKGAKGAPKKEKPAKRASPAKKTPKAAKQPAAKRAKASRSGSKTANILDLLKRPGGATLAELMEETQWQSHSVRGFLSGTVGKKMGLAVVSAKSEEGERTYSVKA